MRRVRTRLVLGRIASCFDLETSAGKELMDDHGRQSPCLYADMAEWQRVTWPLCEGLPTMILPQHDMSPCRVAPSCTASPYSVNHQTVGLNVSLVSFCSRLAELLEQVTRLNHRPHLKPQLSVLKLTRPFKCNSLNIPKWRRAH